MPGSSGPRLEERDPALAAALSNVTSALHESVKCSKELIESAKRTELAADNASRLAALSQEATESLRAEVSDIASSHRQLAGEVESLRTAVYGSLPPPKDAPPIVRIANEAMRKSSAAFDESTNFESKVMSYFARQDSAIEAIKKRLGVDVPFFRQLTSRRTVTALGRFAAIVIALYAALRPATIAPSTTHPAPSFSAPAEWHPQ